MTRLSRTQRGVVLIVAATACFAALDTAAKFVSAAVPVVVVLWFRYLFQAFVTGCALFPTRGRALLKTRHPVLQFVRGALLVLASGLAFLSLRTMPVGEFTAIMMLTPLVITLLAAFSLGERVSWLRWTLVAGGFAGALVVIQPGSEAFDWTMVLPLAAVACNAGFQVLTSKLARVDDAGTMHFYTGAVGLAAASVALPFAWQLPGSALLWTVLILLGLFGTLGHYLLIQAYSRAPAATLTPHLYFQIAFATLAGWLVFAHAPDRWALAGIAVIAACGVAGTRLTARERRAALASPTPDSASRER